MTPFAKSRLVKEVAGEVGFALTGITHAGRVDQSEHYRAWLRAGHAGTMDYLTRNVAARQRPAELLPGARSVICFAVSYRRSDDGAEPAPKTDASHPTGRVAMYGRGRDYHVVLRGLLEELTERLRERLDEPFEARACVDTAPLLERQLARAAGLGWIGKNTLLMHPRLGSYLFLGELLTTLELAPDAPVSDHCGTCTRCLDACPTAAFPAAYRMDASRCISYLTIEHRDDIPPELRPGMGDWVYGCDVCQEVCPFNHDAPPGTNAELLEDRLAARIPLPQLVELRSGEYRRLTKGTAAARASRKMWQRNASIALENCRTKPSQSVE